MCSGMCVGEPPELGELGRLPIEYYVNCRCGFSHTISVH